MNVLVIEPGHGSFWVQGAAYVDEDHQPDPDGEYVTGHVYEHESGWNIPEGGIDIPYDVTYPRKWILKVEP